MAKGQKTGGRRRGTPYKRKRQAVVAQVTADEHREPQAKTEPAVGSEPASLVPVGRPLNKEKAMSTEPGQV
jgi:hypothetical protein